MNQDPRPRAVSRAVGRIPGARELAGPAIRTAAHKSIFVAAGIGLLTAGALCSVPFYPVPMTMQTLAVLVIGGLLGARLGVMAVAGYLLLGLSGAPVFHGGLGGPAIVAGPTGGYLIGFLAAAFVMGLAADRVRGTGKRATPRGGERARSWRELGILALGALLAEAAIYTFGVPWLAVYTDGLGAAVAVGLVPFLLGDALKTGVAIGIVRGGGRLLSSRGLLPF